VPTLLSALVSAEYQLTTTTRVASCQPQHFLSFKLATTRKTHQIFWLG
jgi:hypothetical protein